MLNYENNETYQYHEILSEVSKVVPDIDTLKKMADHLMEKKLKAMKWGLKEEEERISGLSFMVLKRLREYQRLHPF
ncbi:MAG: hypothetical protein Q4C00_06245 [Bacillota bacterium]|nr:hypothetical protein [Bacillota bacterium]